MLLFGVWVLPFQIQKSCCALISAWTVFKHAVPVLFACWLVGGEYILTNLSKGHIQIYRFRHLSRRPVMPSTHTEEHRPMSITEELQHDNLWHESQVIAKTVQQTLTFFNRHLLQHREYKGEPVSIPKLNECSSPYTVQTLGVLKNHDCSSPYTKSMISLSLSLSLYIYIYIIYIYTHIYI